MIKTLSFLSYMVRIVVSSACVLSCLASCIEYDPIRQEDLGEFTGEGVFILNEGNFMYGNSSLSYYDPETGSVENDVYSRVNGEKLGDVGQSMSIRDGKCYLVMNNSREILVIDVNTFGLVGSVTGLTSPRYIHFLSGRKAYVTDLYASRVTIIDPQTCRITGYVDTPGHASTEQMVQYGKYVFTNCWSYDNKILVIDSEIDEVVDEIEVGIQPVSMTMDRYGKIWVITDGGYDGSPYGWEAPGLYRIDASTREVEEVFRFKKGDSPSEICTDGDGEMLYFINKSVWSMWALDERLPVKPLVAAPSGHSIFYGLAVDPANSDVYVADAIDYSQPGVVYRFRQDGTAVDTIRVGVTPGAFCFK